MESEETLHKQVTIKLFDLEEEIDEKLAPLILKLWKLGIATFTSCQGPFGEEDMGYIAFDEAEDFDKFVYYLVSNKKYGDIMHKYLEDQEEFLISSFANGFNSIKKKVLFTISIHFVPEKLDLLNEIFNVSES